MIAVLPAPVSPMICMCCASARSGMRIISLIPSVLMPMPSPPTVLLNSLGVIISGPFSRRPYLSALRRRTSLASENGSWMASDTRPKSSGSL